MNFDFSDDQKLLKEQVAKFLADKCPLKVVRRVLDGNEAFAGEVWKGLVELGVPGIAIPEAYGGLGMTPLELCVVAEEIGRAAAPVPFDTSVVLATEALKLNRRGIDSGVGDRLPASKTDGEVGRFILVPQGLMLRLGVP